ncbi:uncharacterized protein LOC128712799 [Anopheles marshallii]|uniref:uncharacterized protein LOC128712799 n=1 Tax=Anopheles marshallii TaxID=1521116 RepID=UPI00237AB9EE|nr:uncharacterized protein LOC128712799 [Anopheles marshallii]
MAPNVGPRIDNRAPLMYVENVLKTSKMVRDVERQWVIVRENKELLKRINQIFRTKGYLNVNYNYRVHQPLNSDARDRKARAIERQNQALLSRLLRRKATVDSNLPRERKIRCWQTDHQPRMVLEFWERTDRRLCQLTIDLCPGVSFDEITSLGRGKLFRIYDGTLVVIRAGCVHSDVDLRDKYDTVRHLERGTLVRQVVDGREYFLITLRTIGTIGDGQLLGRVVDGSMEKLDLINSYGSKFGRCKELIYFVRAHV